MTTKNALHTAGVIIECASETPIGEPMRQTQRQYLHCNSSSDFNFNEVTVCESFAFHQIMV